MSGALYCCSHTDPNINSYFLQDENLQIADVQPSLLQGIIQRYVHVLSCGPTMHNIYVFCFAYRRDGDK